MTKRRAASRALPGAALAVSVSVAACADLGDLDPLAPFRGESVRPAAIEVHAQEGASFVVVRSAGDHVTVVFLEDAAAACEPAPGRTALPDLLRARGLARVDEAIFARTAADLRLPASVAWECLVLPPDCGAIGPGNARVVHAPLDDESLRFHAGGVRIDVFSARPDSTSLLAEIRHEEARFLFGPPECWSGRRVRDALDEEYGAVGLLPEQPAGAESDAEGPVAVRAASGRTVFLCGAAEGAGLQVVRAEPPADPP